MQKYISLRQFAKMAGVSPATVSHVYTAPSTVAKSTVQHVLELAEKVGFTPSAVARAAFGGATRSIGILASSVYQALNQSIQDTLIAADYLPILITMEGPAPDAVSRLLKHHVDGLILGACNDRLDFSELCARQIRRLPTVILETKRPNLQADSVLSDDYDGGRQAALHLLELGHRHFGVLNSVQDLPAISMDRILGFRDAVRSAGGFLEEHHLLELDTTSPASRTGVREFIQTIRKVLAAPDAPTAFFCTTDYLALYFCKAVQMEGKTIPGDFSVVGFGDLDFSEYLPVPLTSIRQKMQILGASAAELVLKRIREPERPFEHLQIPVELVIRETTAPLKIAD